METVREKCEFVRNTKRLEGEKKRVKTVGFHF